MNTRKMHNTWAMHWERVVFVTFWCWVTCTSWLKFWVPSCHPCTCASLLEFTSLTLYFDLSFTILFHFFPSHAPRAAHWARQPDHHAKPAHLREPRRVTTHTNVDTSPHRLWAQLHGLPASSATPRVPSPTLARHRTWTFHLPPFLLHGEQWLHEHEHPVQTPQTGPSSPLDEYLPRHRLLSPTPWSSPTSWSSPAPLSSTTQPPATSNFQDSLDYTAPSSDLYIDDDALGKLLAEVTPRLRRLPPCGRVCLSVSRHCPSCFDRTGKPVGERDVDQSIGVGVTRNTYSANSKFSENTQAEKVVDRSGETWGAKQLKCTD